MTSRLFPLAIAAFVSLSSVVAEAQDSQPWDMGRIDPIVKAGQELGYDVTVSPGGFGGTFDVMYKKEGQTDQGHGILKKKWDQRETINLTFLPTSTGMKLTSAKKVVEQRPPIGQWKTVTENSEIPAALLTSASKL